MTYVQCTHERPSILGARDGGTSLEQRSVQSPTGCLTRPTEHAENRWQT